MMRKWKLFSISIFFIPIFFNQGSFNIYEILQYSLVGTYSTINIGKYLIKNNVWNFGCLPVLKITSKY